MAKVPGTNDGEVPASPLQRRRAERAAPKPAAEPSPKPAGDSPARTSFYERLQRGWKSRAQQPAAPSEAKSEAAASSPRPAGASSIAPTLHARPQGSRFYPALVGNLRERAKAAKPATPVPATARAAGNRPKTMAERQQERHQAKVARYNAGVDAVAEQQRRNAIAAAAAPEPPAMPAGAAPTEDVTAVVSGSAAPADSKEGGGQG